MKRHSDNIVNIPRKSKLNNIRNDVAIKNQVNRRFMDEQNAQQVPKSDNVASYEHKYIGSNSRRLKMKDKSTVLQNYPRQVLQRDELLSERNALLQERFGIGLTRKPAKRLLRRNRRVGVDSLERSDVNVSLDVLLGLMDDSINATTRNRRHKKKAGIARKRAPDLLSRLPEKYQLVEDHERQSKVTSTDRQSWNQHASRKQFGLHYGRRRFQGIHNQEHEDSRQAMIDSMFQYHLRTAGNNGRSAPRWRC